MSQGLGDDMGGQIRLGRNEGQGEVSAHQFLAVGAVDVDAGERRALGRSVRTKRILNIRYSSVRAKAVLKHTHSRRFARFQTIRRTRSPATAGECAAVYRRFSPERL